METKKELKIQIKGMTCAACVARVEGAIKSHKDVSNAEVSLAQESATIYTHSDQLQLSVLISLVEKAGYSATLIPSENLSGAGLRDFLDEKRKESQSLFYSFLISSFLSLPLVLPMVLMIFGVHFIVPGWIQFALATPIQFLIGWRFYRGAFFAVINYSGNMDLLVALGTSAAFCLSVYELFWTQQGNGHLYFESSAVVITMVLLGKWLESKAKLQTQDALHSLQLLRPDKAHVLSDGKEVDIELKELKLNDIVVIYPGERITVDGVITYGESAVDESLITGESLPVNRKIKDAVVTGSLNIDGKIQVEVRALGEDTVLSKVIKLVGTAQGKKAQIQRLVDQVSAVFVPSVLVVSLITFLSWWMVDGNFSQALIYAVAVLVIACPCALGLATPTSIMVGIGVAAQKGILIKNAEVLERLHFMQYIAFDKTGTLTKGQPEVSTLIPAKESKLELIKKIAALQMGSEHPLARAVLNYTKKENMNLSPAQHIRVLSGRGVRGSIDGIVYFLGSQKFAESEGLKLDTIKAELSRFEQNGETASFLFSKKDQELHLEGAISFVDQLKDSAFNAIESIQKLGVKVCMLTGDRRSAANKIARALNIDQVYFELLPSEKLEVIEDLKSQGYKVAMVGDGLNDAPALAAADIGIALSTGTDVALNASGVSLMRGDPSLIPVAITISKKTYSKIKQNLFWAFIYNILGIPLAAFGYLSPAIAGTAMALSSVSVILNSLLLKKLR